MKPYQINFVFGTLLILVSIWSYFSSESPSLTAFIPAAFGGVFLAMTLAMKNGNKTVAHIVVVLTLIVVVMLAMPLRGAIQRNDTAAILRVALMMIAGVVAMAVYIKSFVDARKNRN